MATKKQEKKNKKIIISYDDGYRGSHRYIVEIYESDLQEYMNQRNLRLHTLDKGKPIKFTYTVGK